MLEIDIINEELKRRRKRLVLALQNNPTFGASRSTFNAMISAYDGMMAFMDHTFDTKNKLIISDKKEDNVLNGWLSKASGGCICIHYCDEKPEKVGDEWFGNEFDKIIEQSRIPGVKVPDEPVRVKISFEPK